MAKVDRSRSGIAGLATIIVIALFVVLGAAIFGFIKLPSITPPTQTTIGPSQAPPAPGTFINYNLGVIFQSRNSFSGGTENPQSGAITAYHSNGRRLVNVPTLFGEQSVAIAAGTTATNIAINKEDNDFLFIRIDTGSNIYPDPTKILASNPAFTGVKWVPTTTASTNQLVAELQLSKLGLVNYAISPPLSTIMLISMIGQDTSLTLSSPADQSTIGLTSGTDVYITWEFTALASNNGSNFARIWITSNQTAADFDVLDITISAPGGQQVMKTNSYGGTSSIYPVRATAGTSSGVTQFWRFAPTDRDAAADIGDGLLIGRSASHADSIQIRAHLKTTFTSSLHGATAVLNYRLINAANALQAAASDSVVLQA